MFDIGWSELIVIAVVALIAIGPKELPGVLRMVGQWMAKLRRMAADFQGQFNDALREAEMADIKKQFDEIKDTAKSFTGANLLGDVQKDFNDALKFEDKPADDKGTDGGPAIVTTPAEPAASETVETGAGADAGQAAVPAPEAAEPAESLAVTVPEPTAIDAPDPVPVAAPATPPHPDTGTVKAS
jgi:sec-independent protein translocase protein TatB